MTTTTPPPRRNWHFTRWLIVLIVAALAWGGWEAYAFRSALKQAEALGWEVAYTDPVETIQKNWKAAFKKETWLDGVTLVNIPTSEAFEQHLAVGYRLTPKALVIDNAATLRDMSALRSLTSLETVSLRNCAALTNVDALKNLSAIEAFQLVDCQRLTSVDPLKYLSGLREVYLNGCTGLTNVDTLKNLPSLQQVDLIGCTGLTPESVAALKAALPKATIYGP